MDGERFDDLVVAFGTHRRAVLRALGAAALAAAGARATGVAAACTKNGKACDPDRPERCCSGTCKKTGRGHACKPTPGAEGCTVEEDACAGEQPLCPGDPTGACVVLDNGKPFCARASACFACDSGADCDEQFGGTGGKCVKHCPVCTEQIGVPRICVFAEAIP